MYSAADLKKGLKIEIDGEPYAITEFEFCTQRALLHTRDISPYADLRVISLMPFIPSFCHISLGESMFRDARSHFNYNVSSQQLRRMLRLDLSILEELFP